MTRTTWSIFTLFFPACLGIVTHSIWGKDLSHQLLAAGFLLFCIDQARMAVVDLQNIAEARKQLQDVRLDQFYWVTMSTIGIELIGFYLAYFWLGWSIIVVLLSQIWFNALATIQLQPVEEVIIQPRPFKGQIPILIADTLGIAFIVLWMLQIAPLGIVLGLWVMAISYGVVKYATATVH